MFVSRAIHGSYKLDRIPYHHYVNIYAVHPPIVRLVNYCFTTRTGRTVEVELLSYLWYASHHCFTTCTGHTSRGKPFTGGICSRWRTPNILQHVATRRNGVAICIQPQQCCDMLRSNVATIYIGQGFTSQSEASVVASDRVEWRRRISLPLPPGGIWALFECLNLREWTCLRNKWKNFMQILNQKTFLSV